MSYEDGWAAFNLQMPKRVPRTEYSAAAHWPLVNAVTGIKINEHSAPEEKQKASIAFTKAWNYDFIWSTTVSTGEFGELRTKMGHAVYAAGGIDWDEQISCPYKEPEEVLAFDPWEKLGKKDKKQLVKMFEERYRIARQNYPHAVTMVGIYISCISGLIGLFGWEMLLLAAGTDPEKFGDLTNRYAAWINQYFEALAEADVPIVMIHDDMVWTAGPFLPPAWYRRYVFANFKKMFAPILDSGKRLIFTSDGTYTEFIDDLVACGVHGFVMEPTTDMKYIADKYGKTHAFVGNADTRILLEGPKSAIRAEVERCMAIGKHCPGYFLAVGNHIPSNTPVENAIYYNQVYEELSKR
jgi:uroporphyrinogen-III decarboxylase